ncbi:tetratricopeptide repeat protein [Embleya sp. NPDC008237]|uniref:tetratricopeptide repeat protein n=1 Tax=Embleya sp. NPDC008237 TaxID=3363978 RepID=UPI0036E8A998
MGDAGGKAAELARSLRELWERAGSPTYATLVRRGAGQRPAVKLNTTSLGQWLTGQAVPDDADRFAFLVTWLEHEATRRDHTYVAMTTAAWEHLRGAAVRERRPAGRPHTPRDGEPTDGGGDFVGRPVREFTDPFALEVHRAIDAPEHTRARLPLLPVYVPRDHDRVLRNAVERAAAGQSTMVTLVARSSTGKTRACWEALQGVPDGWRLWHPLHPSPAEAAAADLSRVGPRTVVWLNEAQTYLEPAGVGQRVATGLRELLDDPGRGPVLVLATLWPDPFWNTLTTRPATGDPDPHAQARALLTGTDLCVPDAFAGADLEAVHARAGEDARLANALASGDGGRVTQYLAGALALLKRYELAPAGARAVIEAAMDARRLGHGPVLRQAFLEDAADAYLTDHESDALADDWFEQALAYATNVPSVHGATAPLTRIRPRRRRRIDTDGGPTYRLADYLEQHARHTRASRCPSTSFWTAAHDHAHTTDDTLNLAHSAWERLRLRHAKHLYAKATNAGDPRGRATLARRLEEAQNREVVELYCHLADDAGLLNKQWGAAWVLGEVGARKGADARDPHSPMQRAELLDAIGEWAGAKYLYRQAADAGESHALIQPARLLEMERDREGAERVYREAAEAGHLNVLGMLAWMRGEAGDREGAQRLYRKAEDTEDAEVLIGLGMLLEEVGDREGARRVYRKAADAGDPRALLTARALTNLGKVLEKMGDPEGAQRMYRQAAEHLYRQVADTGEIRALRDLGGLLEKMGDPEGAQRMYRQVADAGHVHELWDTTGRNSIARVLLRRGLDADDDLPPFEEETRGCSR